MSFEYDFFRNSPYAGEMLPLERYKLFNMILDYKPNNVLEIGCGLGGGSTYYILKALELNKKGVLFTCDPERAPSQQLLNEFNKKCNYYNITSDNLIDKLLKLNIIPDFIFFDGPENPDVALQDFITLDEKLEIDTIFSMHDWCDEIRLYDNNISTKAKKIKPYINSSEKWILLEELSGRFKNSNFDNFEFDSVGMVFYKKIKK